MYGSLNHPDGCGQACKYVHRKGGCRDGQSCPNCHFCQWTRQGKKQMPSNQRSFVLNLDQLLPGSTPPLSPTEEIAAAASVLLPKNPPPGLTTTMTTSMPPLCLSVGSTGHPSSCGAPCKYAQKPKGCKAGVNCERCHLCRWSKNSKTEKTKDTMGHGLLFTL